MDMHPTSQTPSWDGCCSNWQASGSRRRQDRPRVLGVFFHLAPAGTTRWVRAAYVVGLFCVGAKGFALGILAYVALGIWFRLEGPPNQQATDDLS